MEFEALASIIREKAVGIDRVAIALSGGVDSGLVAAAASHAIGMRAVACTAVSEVTPARDRARAIEVAGFLGMEHRLAGLALLDDLEIRENSEKRCYYCKRQVFQAMQTIFGSGCLLLDGTNHDDDQTRPGLRAVSEFDVYSPLYEAGIGKAEVRNMARGIGLPNWDAPSESCLATRIPPGVTLTISALSQIETMETFFHRLGVETVRARPDNLMVTVEHLPQYAEIMNINRDNFVALTARIGFRSCRFKEWDQ